MKTKKRTRYPSMHMPIKNRSGPLTPTHCNATQNSTNKFLALPNWLFWCSTRRKFEISLKITDTHLIFLAAALSHLIYSIVTIMEMHSRWIDFKPNWVRGFSFMEKQSSLREEKNEKNEHPLGMINSCSFQPKWESIELLIYKYTEFRWLIHPENKENLNCIKKTN